jgi:hypothetical protein
VIAQELPIPAPSAGEVRGAADDILERPEYHQTESLLERAGGWLDNLLSDILGGLGGSGLGSLIAWLILLTLVGGLIWLLLRLSPAAGLARVATTEAVVRTSGPAATNFRDATEWRKEAARLAADGRYDEALRARYRALLADLIDGGLIEDIPGRTPGEYRRDLQTGASAEVSAPFADATDLFETIWYGPDVATSPDLDRFEARERAVLAGVRT